MNTQHLLYFVTTVECGSVGKAAQKLLVNHSSIIYALNELEKNIGKQLVIREKNRLIITEMGERVYEDAKLVLAVTDSWLSDSLEGTVIPYSIDAVPCIFNTILPDLIDNIKSIYPSLYIQSKEIASVSEVLYYKQAVPDLFLSTSFERESIAEQSLLSSKHIEKLPLFKSRVAFFCNRNCIEHMGGAITEEEIRSIPLCTYFVSSVDLKSLFPLLSLKEIYFVENQLEAIEQMKVKKVGSILPKFLKGFTHLIDPEKIQVYDIEGCNIYSYISLYYAKFLRKSYINNRIINLIQKYPYFSIEGIEKI